MEKISNISGKEYQETGTGKLVQRIENGALAGRDMLYHFWFRLIRELIPTAGFSLIYIWQIYPRITVIIVAGYLFVFLVTKLLIKFLQQIKEKIMGHEELLNHYLIRGFMEMTVGAGSLAACQCGLAVKTTLTSFMISFGGLSVLGQSMSMLGGCDVSFGKIFIMKLSHGLISAIITFTIIAFVV